MTRNNTEIGLVLKGDPTYPTMLAPFSPGDIISFESHRSTTPYLSSNIDPREDRAFLPVQIETNEPCMILAVVYLDFLMFEGNLPTGVKNLPIRAMGVLLLTKDKIGWWRTVAAREKLHPHGPVRLHTPALGGSE